MRFLFAAVLMSVCLLAQTMSKNIGAVQGTVKDQTEGVIPGATVTLTDTDQKGKTTTVTTGADGTYEVRNLPTGIYSVLATYSGLQQNGSVLLTIGTGRTVTGNVVMAIQGQKQEVNVADTVANQVNTDPANNASALVLRQEDLGSIAGRSG